MPSTRMYRTAETLEAFFDSLIFVGEVRMRLASISLKTSQQENSSLSNHPGAGNILTFIDSTFDTRNDGKVISGDTS